MRRLAIALATALPLALAARGAPALEPAEMPVGIPVEEPVVMLTEPLVETPALVERVEAGDLPPVAERLPDEPLRVDLAAKGREPGTHGGAMRMFMTRAKDVRYMAVYGYARLVGYDHAYRLVPDLLRDVTVSEDGRVVTFRLRRGHKWSDGHPFTSEDLRYWWEDVALNPELFPAGPPVDMLGAGGPPLVEVLDEVTIRYSWDVPNPLFLPALARARPLYIYAPAHYLKRFHADHADPEALAAKVEEEQARNWAALHHRLGDLYDFDNPELPVLQPWVNITPRNRQRYVLERNPFYHRVDPRGRQLPYIDTVEIEVASGGLIPAKVTLGEATLQVRSLSFADAPVLKRSEAKGAYAVHLWDSGYGSEVALYPNLNYGDDAWRALFRDTRFRRALSLAISRKAINKVLYFGLAKERAVAALEESPFFDPAHATAWARFDPDEANRLLDEIGLVGRNDAGYRLLPDGRPMEVIVETAGERREVTDTLELIGATWERIGIRLLVRPLDRDILRNRAYAGSSMMVAWWGWNNGVPTPEAPPFELAPVDQANFSWPRWGQHHQTQGSAGVPVDLAPAARLLELYGEWMRAAGEAAKAAVWREMLAIHADEVFCIGTVSRAPMPVAAGARLRNVPAKGLYAWDPGAHLGIHRIDEFFLEGGG
ncbi:MAG TPA: ABC transporter substrate-binding protein [Thermohalobaculum sp.]|nr:ABC transporter substrate-binding protein [Thermohalobaculum sp.]